MYCGVVARVRDEADKVGGVELTVRVAAELAVPLLVVVTVKVVCDVDGGYEAEVDLDGVTNSNACISFAG